MENEAIVCLTVEEYRRLLIQDHRCAIIEGLIRKAGFVSDTDLRVILDIEEKDGANNG